MAKLYVDTIEPEGATTTLTLGLTGDTVTSSADSIKTNTFKDAGGNTLWTSDGSGTLSSVNSGLQGTHVYISTTTISSGVGSVAITSGITSTYKEYIFYFINMIIHIPRTDNIQIIFIKKLSN